MLGIHRHSDAASSERPVGREDITHYECELVQLFALSIGHEEPGSLGVPMQLESHPGAGCDEVDVLAALGPRALGRHVRAGGLRVERDRAAPTWNADFRVP